MRSRPLLPKAVCALALLALAVAAGGQHIITWTGDVDDDWYKPGNWDRGIHPADDTMRVLIFGTARTDQPVTIADTGEIEIHNNATVTLGDVLDVQAGGLLDLQGGSLTVHTLRRSGGQLDLRGGSCTIQDGGAMQLGAGPVRLGDDAGGATTVSLGVGAGLSFRDLTISGDVEVDGNSIDLAAAGLHGIGQVGGMLTVEEGGSVALIGACTGDLSGSTGTPGAGGSGPGGPGGAGGQISTPGGQLAMAGTWSADGGAGGVGGEGATMPVQGMPGGGGGDGGDGGRVVGGAGVVTIHGAWAARGGDGGRGGQGGLGITVPFNPGTGGRGGRGGDGGRGGAITIPEGGQLTLGAAATIDLSGGAAGPGGPGGTGDAIPGPSGDAGQPGTHGALALSGGRVLLEGTTMPAALVGGSFEWDYGTLAHSGDLTFGPADPIGAAGGSDVTAGRVLEVGGTLSIGAGGGIVLHEGRVAFGDFDNSGGLFIWTAGTLAGLGDLVIDSDDPFGAAGTIAIIPGRVLEAAGELSIGSAGLLAIAGGRVACQTFSNTQGGSLHWQEGTLALTGDAAIQSASPFGAVGGDAISAGRALEVGGTLTIDGGGAIDVDGGSLDANGDCFLGGPTGPGTLTVGGEGGSGRLAGLIAVGNEADADIDTPDGVLNVLGGASLRVGGDALVASGWGTIGSATVRGDDGNDNPSTWQCGVLNVGVCGLATVAVEDGGRLETTGGAMLGINGSLGADGRVDVAGIGSRWVSPVIVVGVGGPGNLAVADGGTVETGSMTLGNGWMAQGDLVISGSNSRVTVEPNQPGTMPVAVGAVWRGTLTIEGGGLLDGNGDAKVAGGQFAIGQATIEGPGSRWRVGGGLYLGGDDSADGNGLANVTVTDSGELSVGGELKLWNAKTLLTLDDAAVRCAALDNSRGGTFRWHGGTLAVAGDLTIDSAEPFGALERDAELGPGRRLEVAGALTVTGGGLLSVALAGPAGGPGPPHDTVAVDGNTSLAGVLELDWLPIAGDPDSKFGGTYDILTCAGEMDGTFDDVGGQIGPAYVAAVTCGVDLGGGTKAVRVELHALLDCDTDLSGEVDYLDYVAARDGFESGPVNWPHGDSNLDGRLDRLDYLLLKASFGQSVTGAAVPVPEPASLALLAAGMLALLRRRR